MDLTRLDSVLDFCREIVESEERIDAVVNNAGESRNYTRIQKWFILVLENLTSISKKDFVNKSVKQLYQLLLHLTEMHSTD